MTTSGRSGCLGNGREKKKRSAQKGKIPGELLPRQRRRAVKPGGRRTAAVTSTSHFIGYLTTRLIFHRLTSILMWLAAVLMTHLFSQNASGDIVYLFSDNGRLVFSSVLYYFFV